MDYGGCDLTERRRKIKNFFLKAIPQNLHQQKVSRYTVHVQDSACMQYIHVAC